MKKLDSLICGFAIAFGILSVVTAILIGITLCNKSSDLKIAIVTACVLTVMSGIILTILLLMKKQILPEEVHNDNKLNELLGRMVVDSSIEEEFNKKCKELRKEIDSKVTKMSEQLETLKSNFNEYKEKQVQINNKEKTEVSQRSI